jgi:hypothetical protein
MFEIKTPSPSGGGVFVCAVVSFIRSRVVLATASAEEVLRAMRIPFVDRQQIRAREHPA